MTKIMSSTEASIDDNLSKQSITFWGDKDCKKERDYLDFAPVLTLIAVMDAHAGKPPSRPHIMLATPTASTWEYNKKRNQCLLLHTKK